MLIGIREFSRTRPESDSPQHPRHEGGERLDYGDNHADTEKSNKRGGGISLLLLSSLLM